MPLEDCKIHGKIYQNGLRGDSQKIFGKISRKFSEKF